MTMTPPIIETPRLSLRPPRVEDAPALQRWFSNWNVVQHLTTRVPWPYPHDGAITFLRDVALPAIDAGEALSWAITQHGHDELVGFIEYMFEDTGAGNRGFWLAEHLWGRGYMTEAVTAVQDYVLLELGVERMIVLNSITNPASRRIKEKTGARLLGQVELAHHNGEPLSDKWEVTREDWARYRAD